MNVQPRVDAGRPGTLFLRPHIPSARANLGPHGTPESPSPSRKTQHGSATTRSPRRYHKETTGGTDFHIVPNLPLNPNPYQRNQNAARHRLFERPPHSHIHLISSRIPQGNKWAETERSPPNPWIKKLHLTCPDRSSWIKGVSSETISHNSQTPS